MQKNVPAEGTTKSDSLLSRVSRQGRNYSTLVLWLLHTAFRGRMTKLAVAMVLTLVHLGAQGAAIYAVYWYGRQMETTGIATVPYLNIEVNLKDQPEWLWAVVIFSTFAFVVSAALLYLARRVLLDIVEQHYARKMEQLVLLSLHLPDSRVRLASSLFMQFGVGGLGTGCRRGALNAIAFANAVGAVVGGLGAAAFLVWIDPSLTFLILISVGLAAFFLYPLTLRAVKAAKDREKAQEAFRAEVRKHADQNSPGHTVERVETADEMARAYMMRRRVLTELVFAIEIGVTLILGLVIYYMASEALAGREQWAIFLAYIAALRMTLYGIAQPIRAFASVSRFYPQIVRYYLFSKDMQKLHDAHFAKVERGETVILGTLHNGEDVVVQAGDCLALAALPPMREVEYVLISARLPHSTAPLETIVVDPANVSANDAALALVSASGLDKQSDQIRDLLEGALKDKVTLIVYVQADKIGTFGETRVLTLMDGELQRFALLGTEEGDAALKEFQLKADAKRRMKKGVEDDDEDEDDD